MPIDFSTLGMPPAGLQGKVAIVTGVSRRQGIGAAVCESFAACGADILFTHWQAFDRTTHYGPDEYGPAAIERTLRAYGVRVIGMEVDLAGPGAARRVLDRAREGLGTPSILVNNAAHAERRGIATLDAATLDRHLAVNVRGMTLLCAEFVRGYDAGPGGRIINLTSGQSVGPMPGELPYIASKGAVEAFTATLAVEVAARGITVNAVDPGATDTGWMSADLQAEIIAGMGMGRVGRPLDAARLITFLASEAAGWITGQVIHSRGA